MTIFLMSNFHQLTIKLVYINKPKVETLLSYCHNCGQ
jgi:hypothetical protein